MTVLIPAASLWLETYRQTGKVSLLASEVVKEKSCHHFMSTGATEKSLLVVIFVFEFLSV